MTYKWIVCKQFNLNELELICIAIVSTQLNCSNNCYLTLIILFNINPLFAYSEVVISIAI